MPPRTTALGHFAQAGQGEHRDNGLLLLCAPHIYGLSSESRFEDGHYRVRVYEAVFDRGREVLLKESVASASGA